MTSAGVGAVHGVQVRKPQGRDVLRCYVGASSVENIRVSALLHSVGFTFIFLFEQEVTFFSAKSLKVNPNLAACRRMVIFQKQHSCPREREREHRLPATDLMKLLEEAEHRVQREIWRARAEAPGLRI